MKKGRQHSELAGPSSERLPIAVDLDGTLLRSDTLHESLVSLLARRPWMILPLIFRLFAGKAAFKRYVTQHAEIDVASIPENAELVAYLTQAKGEGRRIGLFSAADDRVVAAFAERFGIFDLAVGSDGSRNLSGRNKLERIRTELGNDFVYAGDHRVDLPIWQASAGAIIVGGNQRIRARLVDRMPVERDFPRRTNRLRCWASALRVHQWAKNSLVFIAGLLALPILRPADLLSFLVAFVLLSVVASATYLINDLTDLAADRRHHSKKERPLASCSLPISQAVGAVLLLLALAAGLALLMPPAFLAPLGVYLATTVAYSFRLKQVAMLDVLCLGFLFTLRIAAGATLVPHETPYWLFAFSMFFFTSLALVKRYSELLAVGRNGNEAVAGRGYQSEDSPIVLAAGIGMAIGSLIIFLIYLADQHFNRNLFSNPGWLGLAGGVLAYWLLRVWLLTVRGQMHDDPVLFALRDRTSYVLGLVVALALFLAW